MRDRTQGATALASVASHRQGSAASNRPALSADGRTVAFESSSQLDAADLNGVQDVYARDLLTGAVDLVSRGDAASGDPAVSADGRFVVFESDATNLVADDANSVTDVYRWDRLFRTVTRVSVGTGTVEGNGTSSDPAITADGRYVAFESGASNLVAGDTNGVFDIFIRDTLTGTTTRANATDAVPQANGSSTDPSISPDGGFVAFESDATNLVTPDVNGMQDVFLKDLVAGGIARVSDGSGGQGNGPSEDPDVSSNVVVFDSAASNLVAGDTNAAGDVFVRDGAVVARGERCDRRHRGGRFVDRRTLLHQR